jgi:hypothetical protein
MKIMSRYPHSSLFFSSFILHVYNEIYAINIVRIISSPIIIIYSVNSRKLKRVWQSAFWVRSRFWMIYHETTRGGEC